MTRGRGDLRNDYFVDLRAARFDSLCFDAGACQQIRDVFRVFWKIDKFAQPVNGKFHVRFNVMSSEVETSPDISGFRNSKRFLGFARNDKRGFTRIALKTADRSARRGGYQGYRTKSWRVGPCPGRKRSRSISRDRKLYRRALC